MKSTPVFSRPFETTYMWLDTPSMTPTRCTSSSAASSLTSWTSPLCRWLSPLSSISWISSSTTTTMAFTATNHSRAPSHGHHSSNYGNQRGRSNNHGSHPSNCGQSSFGQGHHPPHCQICHIEGHYANCYKLRYAQLESSAHLIKAFSNSCSLRGPKVTDQYLDTIALAHMATNSSILDQSSNYTGKDSVIVENDSSLPKPTLAHFVLFPISLIRCISCLSSR